MRASEGTFIITRSDGMYIVSRSNPSLPFGAPSELAALKDPSGEEIYPWLSSDGTVLYFERAYPDVPSGNDWKIFRADRQSDGGYANETWIPNTCCDAPVVTANERELFAMYNADIRHHERTSKTAGWTLGTSANALNVATNGIYELPNWISDDGCVLYLTSNRPPGTKYRIYRAQRPR